MLSSAASGAILCINISICFQTVEYVQTGREVASHLNSNSNSSSSSNNNNKTQITMDNRPRLQKLQNMFKLKVIMKTANEAMREILDEKDLNITEINHLI